MMPLRERIVRKAKERAVESLHELTTNQNNRSFQNNSNNSTTLINKTSSNKRNNRSYKPFAEQTHISDEEQSDNEVETPKKTRTRRKTNTTGLTNQQQQQQAKSATKSNKNNKDKENTELESDQTTNSLFTQVYNGQVSIQSIVDDWIELYKKDRDTAMLDLIKFIVRCSGCKAAHMLTDKKDLLRTKEFTESINELIDCFNDDDDASSGEAYPLIQTSVQARRFKSNFCEFIQILINNCQYSIVYDQFMLDILITFLIALADSQVRAFRHTATLAVLKIMTALVDVLLALSIAKDANQKQYDNEKQKSQLKRAADRIEMLTNKKKELEENEYEIQNFINFIFKAVFIHRYRDVCSDIRCVCINEIGEWMKKCPEKFLDDTFLKYIGWTLYDKVGECRLKCLQALQPLYEQEDLFTRLELFTSRFKNRILEMSLDKDYEVSVASIKLLTTIITQNDSALEDRDCENLYELVYHANRHIAQAAGEFLNQKLFVKIENPVIEFRRGKKQSENSNFIQLLVQFLIESELHDHPTYLVDAMWDTHPMLKDWECMTDLLLEDPINSDDVLSDTHERYLIEILNCCVKQAATGEYPISRRTTTTNRKLTSKEAKQVQDDRIELTQHFIQTLPDLITKYIADAEKLVFLLQIPCYFDLNQYTLRRQEKNLERLLKLIQDIVSRHNDSNVLEESSICLSYLCDEDQAIYSKCNVIRSTILDNLVEKFTNAMNAFEQLTEVDESEMYPLIIALKRLSAFAENHNIVQYDLVNNTFTILKWAIYNEGFNLDFVNKALNLARSIIMWNLSKLNTEMDEREHQIEIGEEDEQSPINQQLIDYIAKLSKKFYKTCNKLFVNDNPSIEEEAYFELCDLLILFNIHMGNSYKGLYRSLILECSTNDINMLSVYVMNNAFTNEALTEKADTAENIEKLHKRRSVLASFCKLICFNCVPIKYAAEIFRGYVKYSSSYGDIMKQLLSSCREISKVNTARTIALALQREYVEAINMSANRTTDSSSSNNNINSRLDRNSSEFISLKELAHKFCLSFGPEASVKSREAIITIHQEAIAYANESPSRGNQAPINLPFLEVIIEFSSRLSHHDKKTVLTELDRTFAKRANKIESNNWQPYYSYRISLMEDYHSITLAQNQTNNATTANQTSNETRNETRSSPESSTLAGSSIMNELVDTTNSSPNKRKRKQNNSVNVSGVSKLRQSINIERNKQLDKVIPEVNEENENEENLEDETENVEHFDQNSHADSTANDLEVLKISSIKHSDSNIGRVTRSAKGLMTRNAKANLVTNNTNNKRSRSPLVSNNSINESIDQNNFLSSTRIEPKKLTKTVRSSIGITMIAKDNDDDEDEQSAPMSKRKRKSEENEQEFNENSNLIQV